MTIKTAKFGRNMEAELILSSRFKPPLPDFIVALRAVEKKDFEDAQRQGQDAR